MNPLANFSRRTYATVSRHHRTPGTFVAATAAAAVAGAATAAMEWSIVAPYVKNATFEETSLYIFF